MEHDDMIRAAQRILRAANKTKLDETNDILVIIVESLMKIERSLSNIEGALNGKRKKKGG